MAKRGLSENRNVLVTFTDGGSSLLPIDAHKSAFLLVEELEDKYARLGATATPDLTAQTTMAIGTKPYQVHLYELTTVMANATYVFDYQETVPSLS